MQSCSASPPPPACAEARSSACAGDHVHLDTGRIEVTQAITAVGYRLEFSQLKTRTSRRNITLDAATVAMLAEWRRRQAEQLAAAGVDNLEALVFTGADGRPLHPHAASQAFGRAQRRLDVPLIRFHDLRHTPPPCCN